MPRDLNTYEPRRLEDQFALLVSSVVDYAIFMLDPTGRIVTWNEGAQRIKGYSAGEIIGQHFSIFYPEEEKRSGKPAWELDIATREGRYQEEGWRLRKDGTRFWANVDITALRDETGLLRGFGKVTRDLTDQHEREEERKLDRDREAAQLRAHADRMAELERTKTEFLNLASHELRGPLAVVRGYNSMIEDGSIPPGQLKSVAGLMEAKLAQMDLLVEQMLETARLDHERLELHRELFDLRPLAEEQLKTFRPLAQGHTLVMAGEHGPVWVNADRSRIGTIVANLLDNALKYAPDGGEIRCTVGVHGSEAFVSVRDEGMGIARDHLARLFTRFGRLPTEENVSIPGTGLGLFLCREIALRHGGDIEVISTEGAGSEFTVRLPAAGQG